MQERGKKGEVEEEQRWKLERERKRKKMGTSRWSFMSPWFGLVASIWLQSINNTNSTFSAYSSSLKDRLGISQVELSHLAVATDAGKLFAWVSGLAAGHLPTWLVLVIGSVACFVGYGVQYLFLTDQIQSLAYWQAILLCALAGNGMTWINTICYTTAMRNFPADHSMTVGLTTSYMGLTAKFYSSISRIFFLHNNSTLATNGIDCGGVYLLLNAVMPVGVSLVAAPFINSPTAAVGPTFQGLVVLFLIACATGVFTAVEIVVPTFKHISMGTKSIFLVGLIVLPVVVPISKGLGYTGRVLRSDLEENVGDGNRKKEEEEDHEDCSVKELMCKVDFWLYFFVYLCSATLGNVYLNNLGQISESRGMSDASTLLTISSAFAFFGGLLSAVMNVRGQRFLSKSSSVMLLMIPMAPSFFLLLKSSHLCLVISTAILGLCAGAIRSMAVSLTADLFGEKNLRISHNIILTNVPIGSFLFGSLAAVLYDQEGCGGGISGETRLIHRCYNTTFILLGCVCSVGTILSFVLHRRVLRRRTTAASSPSNVKFNKLQLIVLEL